MIGASTSMALLTEAKDLFQQKELHYTKYVNTSIQTMCLEYLSMLQLEVQEGDCDHRLSGNWGNRLRGFVILDMDMVRDLIPLTCKLIKLFNLVSTTTTCITHRPTVERFSLMYDYLHALADLPEFKDDQLARGAKELEGLLLEIRQSKSTTKQSLESFRTKLLVVVSQAVCKMWPQVEHYKSIEVPCTNMDNGRNPPIMANQTPDSPITSLAEGEDHTPLGSPLSPPSPPAISTRASDNQTPSTEYGTPMRTTPRNTPVKQTPPEHAQESPAHVLPVRKSPRNMPPAKRTPSSGRELHVDSETDKGTPHKALLNNRTLTPMKAAVVVRPIFKISGNGRISNNTDNFNVGASNSTEQREDTTGDTEPYIILNDGGSNFERSSGPVLRLPRNQGKRSADIDSFDSDNDNGDFHVPSLKKRIKRNTDLSPVPLRDAWDSDESESIIPRKRKAKKVSGRTIRPRVFWSEYEENLLRKGLKRFGVGKWSNIFKAYFNGFHHSRDAQSLKDKYRNWKKAEVLEEKMREGCA